MRKWSDAPFVPVVFLLHPFRIVFHDRATIFPHCKCGAPSAAFFSGQVFKADVRHITIPLYGGISRQLAGMTMRG